MRRNIFSRALREFVVASWAFFHTQGFWKYVPIAFSLYLVGIMTIIRADVYYIDDWNRAVIGYKEWDNFSRYISWFLATFMHMDTVLADVAPLTQLVAIGFLSFASVILVWSIREVIWKKESSLWEDSEVPHKKRLTVLGIIASLPIGLSPYFLEELSFRYDSPYMALSVLFSVIPFVFIHHVRAYIPVGILCSLGMCMTYQASSGIEIILVLFFAFLMINQTNAGLKKTIIFVAVSLGNYLIALGIFKLFIMHPMSHSQASTEVLPKEELVSGVIQNLNTYLDYLWHDFGWSGIKICFLCLVVFFIISAVYQSKINKSAALILALAILIVDVCLSYGIYLVLSQPLTRPRAFIGIGVFTAILAIYVVSAWRGWAYKKQDQKRTNSEKIATRNGGQRIFFVFSAIVVGFFSWSLVVFANSYGNALSKQNEYQNFRLTILLSDLANAVPKQAASKNYLYRIKGWITSSPVLENSSKSNRIMKRLVSLTDGKWWVRTAMKHYGWGDVPDEQLEVIPESEDWDKLKSDPRCNPETAGKRLKLVDNVYHRIETYRACTIIEFKGYERFVHKENDDMLESEDSEEPESSDKQSADSQSTPNPQTAPQPKKS
ncbi:glucosyltransferase domain-containing protein [uncultured Helicobacter sp.]|uniref:glucosyltransferase domain-containing protein n=1 Tax=uncultured Helicobacter sp. TaxID=175537 RepID=UPI00374F694E